MDTRFRRAAVLGAGVMGSGIAAHLAGAGLDVLLLDIVPPDAARPPARNALRRTAALDKALKAKPAAFFHPRDAERVRVGNLEDDLAEAGQCDLVIEAVSEDLDVKQALFARLETLLGPRRDRASNTSGLPIAKHASRAAASRMRQRFLVTHFFNPVRYMKLLELVAGRTPTRRCSTRVARFGEDDLGKGIVFGKDTPNFVANRIGVYGMMATHPASCSRTASPSRRSTPSSARRWAAPRAPCSAPPTSSASTPSSHVAQELLRHPAERRGARDFQVPDVHRADGRAAAARRQDRRRLLQEGQGGHRSPSI